MILFGILVAFLGDLEVRHCHFAVSAADSLISTVKNIEVSQIADELSIEHREFRAIRSAFKD